MAACPRSLRFRSAQPVSRPASKDRFASGDRNPPGSKPIGMRRALPTRYALVVAFVTCASLTSTTSWALYRATLGPWQCCKTHCPHRRAASDTPSRCCSKQPKLVLAAPKADSGASQVLAGAMRGSPRLLAPALLGQLVHETLACQSVPLPHSLLAQRTSLLL